MEGFADASRFASGQDVLTVSRPRGGQRVWAALLLATDSLIFSVIAAAFGLFHNRLGLAATVVCWAFPCAVILALARRSAYVATGALPKPTDILSGLVHAAGLVGLCGFLVIATGYAPADGSGILADRWFILAFMLTAGAAIMCRCALWARLRPMILPRIVAANAVICGSGPIPASLLGRVRDDLGFGTVIPLQADERGMRQAEQLVRDGVVSAAFLLADGGPADGLVQVARRLGMLPIATALLLDPVAWPARKSALRVMQISAAPLSQGQAIVKRIEDLVLASFLLFAAAPAMLAAAIAIKLDSPGTVLFRQPRYGYNHALIKVVKFRTMHEEFEDLNASAQTSRGDPRVTRVGAFLRRHSLDELPQIFNVLAGSMSLVGPRPHAVGTKVGDRQLEAVVDDYVARHRIKPGITGWAQVSGWRGNLDSDQKAIQRVEHDLYYIENWSLLFDLRIIFKTVALVFGDPDAF